MKTDASQGILNVLYFASILPTFKLPDIFGTSNFNTTRLNYYC